MQLPSAALFEDWLLRFGTSAPWRTPANRCSRDWPFPVLGPLNELACRRAAGRKTISCRRYGSCRRRWPRWRAAGATTPATRPTEQPLLPPAPQPTGNPEYFPPPLPLCKLCKKDWPCKLRLLRQAGHLPWQGASTVRRLGGAVSSVGSSGSASPAAT